MTNPFSDENMHIFYKRQIYFTGTLKNPLSHWGHHRSFTAR